MSGTTPSAPRGRAWLPASTGLPSDREPTRHEMREAWLRQARGIFEATRAARAPVASARQGPMMAAALLALAGVAFIVAIVLLPASGSGILTAFHVVGGAALLLSLLAGPSIMSADAVAEVTAKSSQAWASSPLATSAWVAGKVAFYLQYQATAMVRLLPFAATSALLGGIRMREVAAIALVSLSWTFVAGVSVAAASLEARQSLAQRLAARRGAFGARLGQSAAFRGNTPPAAGFAVMQIALGIAGAFMVLPFAMSGISLASAPPPVLLLLGAFCALSPIASSASAFFPQYAVSVFGVAVPMWCVSVLVAASMAPLVTAVARLRWRPPDGATGIGVRPASWLAWGTLAALAAAVLRPSPLACAVMACLVPAAAGIAALAAGGSRLPDLAAGRVTGWRRLAGLDRSTASLHGLVVGGVVATAIALIAPAGAFTRLPAPAAMAGMAAAALPFALLGGALGREGRRSLARLEAGSKEKLSRPAGLVLVALVAAALAPVGATMLGILGQRRAESALEALAIASPVSSVPGFARDVLGIALPSMPGTSPLPPASAAVAGLAVQLVLALIAVRLERRSALQDPPLAPPSDGA